MCNKPPSLSLFFFPCQNLRCIVSMLVNHTTEQYYSLPESWCQLNISMRLWVGQAKSLQLCKECVWYVGKVDLKFYRFSTCSLLYPDNAGTQLGEEEHPRLSNSVGDLYYMSTCTISTLSVDRSTIACIHPILGRPITNLGHWVAKTQVWPAQVMQSWFLKCLASCTLPEGHPGTSLYGTHWQGTTEFLIVSWPKRQNCMSMIMYVNSLQHGPLTKPLLKRNLEHWGCKNRFFDSVQISYLVPCRFYYIYICKKYGSVFSEKRCNPFCCLAPCK